MKRCPNCKKVANERDIRRIFADKIVIVDSSEDEANKSELHKLQLQIEKLLALGIKYVECEICDIPFTNDDDKNAHKMEKHMPF